MTISQNILQHFCLFPDWYDSTCGKDRFSVRILAQKQKSAAGANGGVACGLIQIQGCSRAGACDAPGQYPGERQGFLLPYSFQEGREGCSCPRAAVHCGSASNLRWQEGSQQLACVPNPHSQMQAVICPWISRVILQSIQRHTLGHLLG